MTYRQSLFSLAAFTLLFLSCSKDPTPAQGDTTNAAYSSEEEWEWAPILPQAGTPAYQGVNFEKYTLEMVYLVVRMNDTGRVSTENC